MTALPESEVDELRATVRACSLCGRADQACPRLRDDDCYCLLHGDRILHLQIGHAVPDDRVIYLYQKAGAALVLPVRWQRGLKDQPKRSFAPQIDYERSWVQFSGVEVGELAFRLEPIPQQHSDRRWAVARLVSAVEGATGVTLPALGVAGSLAIATSAGVETRKARLFPRPDPIFSVACRDPTHETGRSGARVWQVHERGKAVRLPMTLSARVPLWALSAVPDPTGGHHGVAIAGFEVPAHLVPGHPHPFELVIDNRAWTAGAEVPFQFHLKLANDPASASALIAGKIILTNAPTVAIVGDNPLRLAMQLGQDRRPRFTLTTTAAPTLAGGKPAPGVAITTYQVERAPDVGDWLTVAAPALEQLPRPVAPTGAEGLSGLQFDLLIDTSRLDRDDDAFRELKGTVRLVDSYRRVLEYLVHVTTHRPSALEHDLAIDWGTTNSCAAYRSGAGVNALTNVLLSAETRREAHARPPEQFPSDIYFVDASRRDDPKFEIGEKFIVRAELRPECCVRSVKRKFQTGGTVPVIDEKNPGTITPYPVELIVQHLLFRMVIRAEATLNQEIRKLGLTFPTKWTKGTRDRYARVARRLAAQLTAKYGAKAEVTVHPPEIDEANAVALALLAELETSFSKADVAALGKRFTLIAYDFGGGTVDTSVLEVSSEPATRVLRTRYIGLGGLSHFGGDEVTRAVMMLLRQKLVEALKDLNLERKPETATSKTRVEDVPLEPDVGNNPEVTPEAYWLGRRNWSILWEVAEQIKFDLCGATPPASPVKAHLDPVLSRVGVLVARRDREYDEDLDRYVETAPRFTNLDLAEVFDLLGAERRESVAHALEFPLTEVCHHKIEDIESCNAGKPYSVHDRVKETIDELAWQCRNAETEVWPDVIVLAGGGSRLPLIAELMAAAFQRPDGKSPRFHRPDAPKRLVARGMASYLAFKKMAGRKIEPARSVDVIHHRLGIMQLPEDGFFLSEEFRPIVHAGTPLHSDVWRPFEFIPNRDGPDGAPRLGLFVESWREKRLLGFVPFHDTGAPLPGDPPCLAGPLPNQDEPYRGELRLLGVDRVEVHVVIGGNRHGPFLLRCAPETVESILQG